MFDEQGLAFDRKIIAAEEVGQQCPDIDVPGRGKRAENGLGQLSAKFSGNVATKFAPAGNASGYMWKIEIDKVKEGINRYGPFHFAASAWRSHSNYYPHCPVLPLI